MTRVHPRGLELTDDGPVAHLVTADTAVIFADLLAQGHDLGVAQLGPSQRLVYHSQGRISDREGVRRGEVYPDANAVRSLAFGLTEDHRAYWVCDDPEWGCDNDETDETFGVFVERHGVRMRVEALDVAQRIAWSPTLEAFVAASLDGPPENRTGGCVFRIEADGTEARSIGCSSDDVDDVFIAFDPARRIALISGAEMIGDDDFSRHTWIDLTNGHVLDDLRIPRFMAPPYAPLCVWDGGLALVVAGGHTETQPAGVTLIRPGAASPVLHEDIASAACDRFEDGSIVVSGGVFTHEIGGLARLDLDRLWSSERVDARGPQ